MLKLNKLFSNRFHFLFKNKLTKKEKWEITFKLWDIVIPIFKEKYPKDILLQKSYKATRNFLNNKIDENGLRNITINSYKLSRKIEDETHLLSKYACIARSFDADLELSYLYIMIAIGNNPLCKNQIKKILLKYE